MPSLLCRLYRIPKSLVTKSRSRQTEDVNIGICSFPARRQHIGDSAKGCVLDFDSLPAPSAPLCPVCICTSCTHDMHAQFVCVYYHVVCVYAAKTSRTKICTFYFDCYRPMCDIVVCYILKRKKRSKSKIQ